jgi:hypothetical protein
VQSGEDIQSSSLLYFLERVTRVQERNKSGGWLRISAVDPLND